MERKGFIVFGETDTVIRVDRIARVQEYIVEKSLDGALITSRENLFYFTSSSPVLGGYLVVTPDDATLMVPQLEYEDAKNSSRVPVQKFSTREELYRVLGEMKLRTLGIEGRTSYSTLLSLREKLGVGDFKVIDDVIKELRIVKSPEEVRRIEDACRIADDAMEVALEGVGDGVRERDVAAKMEYRMRIEGADKPAFDTIIASGPRSALPHGVATDRAMKRGDFVVIDEGALYRHYNSDMTRTVVIGSPTEKQADVYAAVLEAQKKCVEAVRPGVKTKELDLLARSVLREYGYEENFIHSLGHGVGLEIHEWPGVSRFDETVLRPGMVITIEPGVYIPGFGGVRIEDTVVVTEDGARRLTKTERDLI
ncbi:MAG: aminopeptidase P family protein [Thermococci archaeon]|nr:aminopeptidase P family protein [Thermococci archaeon]